MAGRDKLVIITRKTALEELIERFNTRDQARFYIERMGSEFTSYQEAHDTYHRAIDSLHKQIPAGLHIQWIERSFLPTFTFSASDVVVVLGQDGLVVNAAKYLHGQLVVALTADPQRIDGVLLPFSVFNAAKAINLALSGVKPWRNVTMAQAQLNDGQLLLAVNDLFIGAKTHTSARYRLCYQGREEDQSSSGLIVSTGAGSTGWYRAILAGAAGIVHNFVNSPAVRNVRDQYAIPWEERRLVFSVREPFVSKTSGAEIVHGSIVQNQPLRIISKMPKSGVIFSDGIEDDKLDFNSGAIAEIALAERTLCLVVPPAYRTPREVHR
jgi:NAD kinase